MSSAPSSRRRRSAIVFTDLVGYSRHAEVDEAGVLDALGRLHGHLANLTAERGGRVVALRGDGALLEFEGAVEAVTCAQAFLSANRQANLDRPLDRRLSFRIGVHLGEVTVAADTLLGASVNLAARLEQTAEPDTIHVSDAIREAIEARAAVAFEDLGFHQIKGMRAPVRTWRVSEPGVGTPLKAPAPASLDDALGDRPAIAVLPFVVGGGDADEAYLAEGLAEDIIVGLNYNKWLFVASRHSSFRHAADASNAAQICAELEVRYLLLGRMRRIGEQIRISVELVDGSKGESVWSARYDRPIEGLFAVQEEITATVSSTLAPVLLDREQQQAVRNTPRSLQHWDLFLRARWHFWRGTHKHTIAAQNLLTQALALRPEDAPSLALLAHCYFGEVWSGWSPDLDGAIEEATRLALRAVRLDAGDAFAHFTHGVALSLTGQLQQGMAEQRHALELNPFFAQATGEIGRLLAFSGETDLAISYLDQAMALAPADPHLSLYFRAKAIAYFLAGRHAEAVAQAAGACTRRPDFFFHHYTLAACQAGAGDIPAAKAALAEGRLRLPHYPLPVLKAGHPFARPEDLARFTDALTLAGWSAETG
ncbi:MAG TPA: adenylate/guanylate cyclase domain-containing protein [Caulobacteraceae bacterium]